MSTPLAIVFSIAAAFSLAACASSGSSSGTSKPSADGGATASVTGTVWYRERIAMPPNASVLVTLQDVSLADAPAVVLGERTIVNPSNVPVPFSVSYDPSKIVDNHSYAISARIMQGDKLVWISDRTYPVITRGSPTKVDVMVIRAAR